MALYIAKNIPRYNKYYPSMLTSLHYRPEGVGALRGVV